MEHDTTPQDTSDTSLIEPARTLGRLNQVTPLSKYLAMLLFVLLPFLGGYVGYELGKGTSIELDVTPESIPIAEVVDDISSSSVERKSPEESWGIVQERVEVDLRPLKDATVLLTIAAQKSEEAPPFQDVIGFNAASGYIELRDYFFEGEVINLLQVFSFVDGKESFESLLESKTLDRARLVSGNADIEQKHINDFKELLENKEADLTDITFAAMCSLETIEMQNYSFFAIRYNNQFGALGEQYPFNPCGWGRYTVIDNLVFGNYAVPIDAMEPKVMSDDIKVIE